MPECLLSVETFWKPMPVPGEMTVSVQNSAGAHSRAVVKHVKVKLL